MRDDRYSGEATTANGRMVNEQAQKENPPADERQDV